MKGRKKPNDVEREKDKSIFDTVNVKTRDGQDEKSIYTSSGKKYNKKWLKTNRYVQRLWANVRRQRQTFGYVS